MLDFALDLLLLARPHFIWAQLLERRSCGGPTTLGGAATCAPFVSPSFMFAGHKLDGLKTVGINPVPLRFLYFTVSFSYFRTNSETIRNTGCQIRKRNKNGLTSIPIVSVFPVFDRDIPF